MATVRPEAKRETSRSSMSLSSFGYVSRRDDDLLAAGYQRFERIEELFLRAALAGEELDVVDQQQIERVVIALEVVKRLALIGAHDIADVLLGMDVADLGSALARQHAVADRVHQVRFPKPTPPYRNSGLYEPPGFSATCIAAARASWLALPVTKVSNVKFGLSRARSS